MGAHAAGFGRQFEHAIHFVSALIVLKCHGLAVVVPFGAEQVVLRIKQLRVGDNGLTALDIEDARHLKRQFIARLGILLLVQLGLKLIGRRRLDIVDITLLHGAYLHGGNLLAIGRPTDVG